MADENKPAFYPRVGNIKAKNFKPAQPVPFIDDPRAMELPFEYGDEKPTRERLEMDRRLGVRLADLERQKSADTSPLEKLAGGLQAGRFLGSAMTQGINSIPTRLVHGDKAADKFMEERIYKPEQPLAYEYAQDVGDFLDKLETEYKIPPVLPEAVALQFLTGPATAQAARAAGRGAEQVGRKIESAMEPVVKGAFERGGLPREMVMAMGANTQSNVIKPYGGNWLGGGEQLGIPENDLRRLKTSTFVGETPAERIPKHEELLNDPTLSQDQRDRVQRMLDVTKGEAAVDNWIDSNLKNYVKKEMATRDDPVRKLAEEGITHMPLRDDLDRAGYLENTRKAEGYPAEGMGKSELARRWENLSDDAIRVTKAGAIQDQANTGFKLEKARAELDAHKKQIDEDFIAYLQRLGGLDIKDREVFDKMPSFQKAEILGDTKYKELQGNINALLGRESGFEKRAGELNPFVSKLDPETRLYSGGLYNLGFDHIVDVLREDVAAGRIRPEQLNKVSMEQAVRRTYEYDQELARKMNEARMTSRAELPVYKEYPEGLKWVELNRPGDFAAESDAMGHSVRGYEPPQGSSDWTEASGDSGHLGYGYGGWEGIKSGRAKVYSLVDAKGEPHVTIETKAPDMRSNYDELQPLQRQADLEADAQNFQTFAERDKFVDKRYQELKAQMMAQKKPQGDYTITQIKGKQNAKPKSEYLPFVQDFVRGGNWSDVRDLKNTDLQKFGSEYLTNQEAELKFKPMVSDALNYLETHPSLERHRAARLARNNFKGDTTSPEYRDLERQAGESIAKDVPYTYAELKALLSSPEDWVDHGETIYTPISTAIQQIEKAKKSLGPLPPAEGMKRGGKVSISNNPDTMMLEVNNQKMKNGEPAYSGAGLIKGGLKAAKPPKIEVPIRFPVSRGPTVPEIRAMAERMAPQVMGEFVRAAPTPSKPNPSESVVGKSRKQFEREKTLPIEYENIKEPVTPEEFDYAKKKGALLIGAQGDVTPGNRMLISIDNQPLSAPVHMQAGPEWELYNPSAWAATDQMAKTWMKRAKKASEEYEADPYLHYHKMTPDANWYAMHHFNSILGHLRPEELKLRDPKLYQEMIEEIRTKDVGFGKHPEFEGFDDPLNLQIHAQMDPNFRRHIGAIFGGPKFTTRYGLNSGQDVLAATSLPELRDLEAGASGYAVVPLDVNAPLRNFEADSQTYDTGFPKAGASGRSKYPSPYQLIYRDTLNWMKDVPSDKKSSEFGRMNMIVPKQQIDNELIEAIGEYQRRMKELTGKKEGGAIKKPAAYIDGNEFFLAAKKYGIKDSMNNLNKIVDLVNKGLSVDDAARQVADTGVHKAAGGAISGDDLILEERPL
jgi:hypothetical protein